MEKEKIFSKEKFIEVEGYDGYFSGKLHAKGIVISKINKFINVLLNDDYFFVDALDGLSKEELELKGYIFPDDWFIDCEK